VRKRFSAFRRGTIAYPHLWKGGGECVWFSGWIEKNPLTSAPMVGKRQETSRKDTCLIKKERAVGEATGPEKKRPSRGGRKSLDRKRRTRIRGSFRS